jgi:type IV pilus assembly protein PilQ
MKTRCRCFAALPAKVTALLFACGLLVVALAPSIRAEEPAPVQPSLPPPAAPAAVAAAPADTRPSIDYVETEIQAALRQLASRASVNLIMGDEVTGKVTVHLEGVEYEEAMRLIAESKGFAYVKEKNVVKVKSRASLESEPVELRTHTLNYAKAEDIKKSIDPALTTRGKTQVDARSNTLIISDTPSNLAKLMLLVKELDTQTPQVLIEAKFVETTKNPKKDLGINWTDTLLNHEVATQKFSLNHNVNGGPWTWATPATAFLDVGQAKAVFSFMNRDSDTELLANPRIVTTDNGKAKISIATQYPIPNFTFSEQTASLQISGFEYKDIGIILTVTPRINKNEFITLDVTPEASSSTENATLQSGGGSAVQIPIINTRTANTTVLIKSGHTLAIGGLMRTDNQNSYTKVPLMGDIPGLGALFRSKSLNKTKRDLLIFLTPTIVLPDAQTGYEQHYSGLPPEKVYADDTWMPQDNAHQRKLIQSTPRTPDPATGPAKQNFGAKD